MCNISRELPVAAGLRRMERRPEISNNMQCYKTTMCRYYLQGRCNRGNECTFAHQPEELRLAPNLSNTKICNDWRRNQCFNPECAYAHGHSQLRDDEACFKTSMCSKWQTINGCQTPNCPFAHSEAELRTLTVEQFRTLPNGLGVPKLHGDPGWSVPDLLLPRVPPPPPSDYLATTTTMTTKGQTLPEIETERSWEAFDSLHEFGSPRAGNEGHWEKNGSFDHLSICSTASYSDVPNWGLSPSSSVSSLSIVEPSDSIFNVRGSSSNELENMVVTSESGSDIMVSCDPLKMLLHLSNSGEMMEFLPNVPETPTLPPQKESSKKTSSEICLPPLQLQLLGCRSTNEAFASYAGVPQPFLPLCQESFTSEGCGVGIAQPPMFTTNLVLPELTPHTPTSHAVINGEISTPRSAAFPPTLSPSVRLAEIQRFCASPRAVDELRAALNQRYDD